MLRLGFDKDKKGHVCSTLLSKSLYEPLCQLNVENERENKHMTTTSEVAQLMRRITQEYDAAQNALTGFASGTARHDFINARLENMSSFHEQLATVIGAEAAITFVAQTCEGEPSV